MMIPGLSSQAYYLVSVITGESLENWSLVYFSCERLVNGGIYDLTTVYQSVLKGTQVARILAFSFFDKVSCVNSLFFYQRRTISFIAVCQVTELWNLTEFLVIEMCFAVYEQFYQYVTNIILGKRIVCIIIVIF